MRKERPGPGAHIAAQLRALNDSAGDKLLADARALWAVRVLDAFQEYLPGYDPALIEFDASDGTWSATINNCGTMLLGKFSLPSADAARLATAEAVWPELLADVRAKLGERP